MNKANCNTCDYKQFPDGGHCYMFRTEPNVTCNAHTARSMRGITLVAKEVGSLIYNKDISDEEFKRAATSLLTKVFASI